MPRGTGARSNWRLSINGPGKFPTLSSYGVTIFAVPYIHYIDPHLYIHVALIFDVRQVDGVLQPRGVDGNSRRLGVIPVAEHDAVAARAQLAGPDSRNDFARRRIDDLDLHM